MPMVGLLLLGPVAYRLGRFSNHKHAPDSSWWLEIQELRRFNEEVEAAHTRSEAFLQREPASSSFSQQPVLVSTGKQAIANSNPGQLAFPAVNWRSAPRAQDAVEEKAPLHISTSERVRVKTSDVGSRGSESHQPAYSRYVRSAPRLQRNDLTDETRAMYLDIGTGLDAGIKRMGSPNEDSLSASENITNLPTAPRPNGLFIVADGMGGHGHGSEASQLAIREMRERVSRLLRSGETDGETIKALLVEGVQYANQRVGTQPAAAHTYGYHYDGRSALGDLHLRGECRR